VISPLLSCVSFLSPKTNCQKWSGLKQPRSRILWFLKKEVWNRSLWVKIRLLSEAIEPVFLAFLAFSGYLHFLVHGSMHLFKASKGQWFFLICIHLDSDFSVSLSNWRTLIDTLSIPGQTRIISLSTSISSKTLIPLCHIK
jgi:hypothetical protein